MEVVYVAGGAGFVGSHLCEALLKSDYIVVCIDNFITSSKKNIEPFFLNKNFIFLEFDITKSLQDKLRTLPAATYIFHLASPASPNKNSKRSYINYPIETLLTNSLGTYNLLEYAKQVKARFLFASTSEIYGDPAINPQKENYFGNVNPNGIRSVYDEAKRFGEAITMAYKRKYGVDIRIARIFNTYGPKMQEDDGRVVSNFITQAIAGKSITVYGDGSQTRSFCFISDMVDGLIKLMFKENLSGEVVNLGNPNEQQIMTFAKLIKDLTKTDVTIIKEPLPEDDPKQRKPDITKAKALLRWEPKVALVEGLESTIQYFKEATV